MRLIYAVVDNEYMTSFYEVNEEGQVKYIYWTDQRRKERHEVSHEFSFHGKIKMVTLSMGGRAYEVLTWKEFYEKANSFNDVQFLRWVTDFDNKPRVKVYETMAASTIEQDADFAYTEF